MNITIKVVGQKLVVSTNFNKLVSGSQQFVRFNFVLDEDWDGLTAFVQFQQNGVAYNQYLDSNKSAYLPSEIQPGIVDLMLYGSGGNVIATTNYLTFEIDENLIIHNASSTEISESLYTQLVNLVSRINLSSTHDSNGNVTLSLINE